MVQKRSFKFDVEFKVVAKSVTSFQAFEEIQLSIIIIIRCNVLVTPTATLHIQLRQLVVTKLIPILIILGRDTWSLSYKL